MVDFHKAKEMKMASRRDKQERRRVSARRRVNEHEQAGSLTTLNIPDGMSLFQVKRAGTYRFDIMPYEAKKGNPYADEGDLYYERTFWVHRGIGPDSGSYVCSSKTFKKPCFICEYRAKLQRDPEADEKLIKDLAPKERQVFNVRDLSDGASGETQIFECSNFLFGKQLDAMIKSADETEDGDEGAGEYDMFADLEEGMTLKVTFVEESMGTFKFLKASVIEFKPRKKPYPESVLEESACLDDVPKEMNYNTLKKIMMQSGEAEDDDGDQDEDEKPKKKGNKASAPADADEDELTAEDLDMEVGMYVMHEEHGKCKIVHISSDGVTLRLRDEEAVVHRGCIPSDCKVTKKSIKEDDDEFIDEQFEKPKKKTR